MNTARFERLCIEAAGRGRTDGAYGFGTLAEKRLHAVIKKYLCEDERLHEVPLEGRRFVADICEGREITEVQTGGFYPMRKKIDYYLQNTEYTVTVVHPIAAVRRLSWVDPESFEIQKPRRVAGERAIALLPELYSLLPHLGDPRLRFRLLLLEVHDFRLQNGKRSADGKKGSTRYERMPISLIDELDFCSPEDFRIFIPDALPAHFTVKMFAELTKLRSRDAYSAVRVLDALGLIEKAPDIGRAMAWTRNDSAPHLLP